MRMRIACGVLSVLVSTAASAAIDRAQQLHAYLQIAAESLGKQQTETLAKIKDDDKRYLAMTYYLRAGNTLSSRWSWTDDQIKAYEHSMEFAAAREQIKKIAAQFSLANPQHMLYANTRVRSLEEQLARWQMVRSIDVAAAELRKSALAQLMQNFYSDTPNDASSKRFFAFLIAWRAPHTPTLAAPGLSLHGRGRAYDFQIRDLAGRTVAGTDTSTIRTIWDGQGWTQKLSTAVHTASKSFVGPLPAPREPWHYEYRPIGIEE